MSQTADSTRTGEAQPERTGADLVAQCLAREGITEVYGVPGTTVMDLIDSLVRHEGLSYLSTRHEQVAGFMADGYSRSAMGLGTCLVSRGPGAANAAIAVHNAYDESIPMLVLIGQVPGSISHRRSFEEMDVVATFTPMTKWTVEIAEVERIPELLQRAIRTAVTGRPGPVVVSLPMDVLQAATSVALVPQIRWRATFPGPDPVGVAEAVRLLQAAERPVLVLGGGSGNDPAPYVALADALGLPVVTTWMRQTNYPNDHPTYLGALGYGAHPVTDDLVREADVLVAIGCRFSEFTTKRWSLISPDTALIHIDIDPEELGKIYPPVLGVVSDGAAAARALFDALPAGPAASPAGQQRAERLVAARATLEQASSTTHPDLEGDQPGAGVSNIAVLDAVQSLVDRPGIRIVQDAPSFGPWSQRYLSLSRPASFFAAAGGAMGWGLPAAMGMARALPDERVVLLAGDGSFWMVAQDFETCVREDIRIVAVVLNNFAYGNTRDRQRSAHEGRYAGVFYDNPDLAAWARLLGGHGIRVERDGDVAGAIEEALGQDRPAVIDVIQDRMYGLPPGLAPPAAR